MLHDPLTFDYETVQGKNIVAIKGRGLQRSQTGTARCAAVAFLLKHSTILVSVNEDTDEIVLQQENDVEMFAGHSSDWVNIEFLSEYVGREIGWCWICRNYLGYADTVLLSFSDIEPNLALCGLASSICFYKMQKM
jgi:hypothetical protein